MLTVNLKDIIYTGLIKTYPELEGAFVDDEDNKERLYLLIDKLFYIYDGLARKIKQYNSSCSEFYAFLMLLAHYSTMSGLLANIDIEAPSGIVTSSAVGDANISYAPPPFTNEWNYWLGQTRYGQEYLAWLSRRTGLLLVNNGGRFV